ncbi:hypothetical protein BCR44DRAFT_1438017 [Catenaria anguillulae PL171]|uniref:Wbp11/ELF5/Saf1 N-terminal domain-containing protein n=1 Tax=Catenaria anguillulae PL171 TaxID=765915 RepID=A0A1Y2HIE0_9FUNG|nr:hypothetical protein BCR44DRAFT_1438017 [Catenaria anguillulae PL171]
MNWYTRRNRTRRISNTLFTGLSADCLRSRTACLFVQQNCIHPAITAHIMKSSNPVEAHRREQRKKEIAKLKKDRDARKQALANHQSHLASSRAKLAEIEELAHSRPLTPAEKAQRKELRSLLATAEASSTTATGGKRPMGAGLRALDADAVDEFGRSLSARGGGSVGSAVFDPLAQAHAALLATSNARTAAAAAAAPIPLTTYASSSSEDDESDPDTLDFDPPFPPLDEPKPPSYRVPAADPVVKSMQGYPPPPMGPIPRHKPQMDPPGLGAPGAGPPPGPSKQAIAGLPPKPTTGVGESSSQHKDAELANRTKDAVAAQVVISAAPVMRDRKADVMRLAPESVRKRMEQQQQQQINSDAMGQGAQQADQASAGDDGADAAYQAFMKEMEGLL